MGHEQGLYAKVQAVVAADSGEGYAGAKMRKPILAALLLSTCGDASPPGFSTGAITTVSAMTGDNSTGGNSTGGSSGSTSSTGTADDSAGPGGTEGQSTGVLRDVGTLEDFGSGQPVGCKGKVDLLFLISSLGTMKTEQTQLVASFPGFVTTIEEKLADFDFHIMAANPDGEWAGWNCEMGCSDDPPKCAANGYECNVYPPFINACDATLAAGLTFNAGSNAANRRCELFGGNRYIISGEPKLDDALECIARVGVSGGNPPMGDALIAALAPDINAEGGCNAGFLRDDALLVVVLIKDNYDTESKSWPFQQYNAILAAKKDPDSVVMLGVVPQPLEDGEQEVPGCTYDNDPGGKIRDLIERFPNRAYGNTCAASYAPFFDQAADLIGEACGKFVPQ